MSTEPGELQLGLVPIAVAIALTAYTVLAGYWEPAPNGETQGGLVFLGIVILTIVAYLALVFGSLIRAGVEKARGNPAASRRAGYAGGGLTVVLIAFSATAVFSHDSGTVVLVSMTAACLVTVGLWRTRRRKPASGVPGEKRSDAGVGGDKLP